MTLKEEAMSEPVVVYTDGACKGNPGPGGWGVPLMPSSNRADATL